MSKVVDIFPANKFSIVCENAAKDIECGLIIGYDSEGMLSIYGSGLNLLRQYLNLRLEHNRPHKGLSEAKSSRRRVACGCYICGILK